MEANTEFQTLAMNRDYWRRDTKSTKLLKFLQKCRVAEQVPGHSAVLWHEPHLPVNQDW